eukprot:scaffold3752_cov117-Isochrysis_galbana.AAC.3
MPGENCPLWPISRGNGHGQQQASGRYWDEQAAARRSLATCCACAHREILQIVAVDDDARIPEDTVLDPFALRIDDG